MKNLIMTKRFYCLQVSVLALLLIPAIVLGQTTSSGSQKTPTSLTGKYEGTVKDSTGEARVTLELVDETGKFSGASATSLGTFKLVKGQMVDGLLTLEFETKGGPHRLSLRQKDDKLVGTALDGTKTADIEFRRIVADEISGEWDGTADANGQPFPFALTLKVDGEKVTGSSSSELGTSTITSGNWKDGRLVFVLDSPNGQIGMVATIVNGNLVGDFDLSGQLTGKWAAIKKKP